MARRRHPPDLPRALGLFMALGAAVTLAGFAALALDLWPDLAVRFGPRVISRVGADGGPPELVVRQDLRGQYVVPGTVNGVAVEKFIFLVRIGAGVKQLDNDLGVAECSGVV